MNETPITDDEVRKLLKAFNGGIAVYHISVRTMEREASGIISSYIRNSNGVAVSVKASRGIYIDSVWQLSVDDLEISLSRGQRDIIDTFMYDKFVKPKIISDTDLRKKMGW